MKKLWALVLLFFIGVGIVFFVSKEGRLMSKLLIRDIKALIFKDRINEMFTGLPQNLI